MPLIVYVGLPVSLKLFYKWAFDDIIDIQAIDSSFFNIKYIIKRGIFPTPKYIYMNHFLYQLRIPKWKFFLMIYFSVILTEYLLFYALYLQFMILSEWFRIDDDININIDIRVRFCLYFMVDLFVQIPIVTYLVLPFLSILNLL